MNANIYRHEVRSRWGSVATWSLAVIAIAVLFFSIFPAVALAFTVFGFVLRGHPDLLRSVIAQLDAYFPGLIKDGFEFTPDFTGQRRA